MTYLWPPCLSGFRHARFHLYTLMRRSGSGGDFVADDVAIYHVLPTLAVGSATQGC